MSDVVGGWVVGRLGGWVAGWLGGWEVYGRSMGGEAVRSERLNQPTTTTMRMMTRKPAHGEINVCDLPIMWVIPPACVSAGVCVLQDIRVRVCECASMRVWGRYRGRGAWGSEWWCLVITAVSISGRQARLRCQFHKQFTQPANAEGESEVLVRFANCWGQNILFAFLEGQMQRPESEPEPETG